MGVKDSLPQLSYFAMTRLFVVLLPLLAAVIAKPWVPGGEPDLEGIALETGLGFNVDEPTAPHADFTRVFTLHGYPMKCGPTEKFEGGTCIPDPEAEGGDDYEGDYGAASDAEGAEESYGAPAEESYGAPAEEALGEYAVGRRGRKAGEGRNAIRRSKGRKTQRRKTQGKRTQRKRTQRKRTQRKGKKTQRKQRRR